MPETPLTPELDTRRRIVITAERLFRTLGYQKTTVADIAKELGMSPANVYRFFPSKADIRDAVGRTLMTEVEAAIADIAASGGPATERLREAFLTINAMNRERYLSEAKMHEMVVAAIEENWGMVVEHVAIIHRSLRQIVADGMAAGEFKAGDPDHATYCMKFAMVSFCHPRLLAECAEMPGPTPEQMIEFCLRALKA